MTPNLHFISMNCDFKVQVDFTYFQNLAVLRIENTSSGLPTIFEEHKRQLKTHKTLQNVVVLELMEKPHRNMLEFVRTKRNFLETLYNEFRDQYVHKAAIVNPNSIALVFSQKVVFLSLSRMEMQKEISFGSQLDIAQHGIASPYQHGLICSVDVVGLLMWYFMVQDCEDFAGDRIKEKCDIGGCIELRERVVRPGGARSGGGEDFEDMTLL